MSTPIFRMHPFLLAIGLFALALLYAPESLSALSLTVLANGQPSLSITYGQNYYVTWDVQDAAWCYESWIGSGPSAGYTPSTSVQSPVRYSSATPIRPMARASPTIAHWRLAPRAPLPICYDANICGRYSVSVRVQGQHRVQPQQPLQR
jgi:hypothetical protein